MLVAEKVLLLLVISMTAKWNLKYWILYQLCVIWQVSSFKVLNMLCHKFNLFILIKNFDFYFQTFLLFNLGLNF